MKGGEVQKKRVYSMVLNLLRQNKNLTEICRILDLSKQNLNNYLRRLIKKEVITKKGRGIYKVNSSLEHPSKLFSKEVRGHAFIWVLRLTRKWDWESRLETKKIKYKLIRNLTPRIMINNRKIWLAKKSIIIYEPHSFYGVNAIDSKKFAVISLLETINKIELRLGINLRPYIFKPAREHYGIIKNDLAQQCNRKGEKIHIRDDLGEEWLWIDDSLSLGELETGGKEALLRNVQVQKWFNSHKKTSFKVTPEFLLEAINKVTQNQLMFNQNFESHVDAIKNLSSAVNELRDEVKTKNGKH